MENIFRIIDNRIDKLKESKDHFLKENDVPAYNQLWARLEELKILKKDIEKEDQR